MSKWFWALFGLKLHYFVINELERDSNRTQFWYYKRRFWHFYKIYDESSVWQAHIETPFRKLPHDNWFSIRFHIGNRGSETPWDGHLTLFGLSWYWGHSGFRNLAERLTRCSGYAYDTRDWQIRISDGDLWWEFAQHDDMCRKHPRFIEKRPWKQRLFGIKPVSSVKVKRKSRRSWRSGNINLSIPEAIWGPYRYTYEDHGVHQTVLKFPDGEYAVILTLQRMFYGRTKVDRKKHSESWTVDVDAPRGIPTHVDHSGGWKGDRTFGFGVKLLNVPDVNYWEEIAEVAVREWVIDRRLKTGFVKPDPLEV